MQRTIAQSQNANDMKERGFSSPIQHDTWASKYRTEGEASIEETWRRVALAIAEAETPARRQHYAEAFYKAQEGFRFIVAGRILAWAGTGRRTTHNNCFVMGAIPDDMRGIFAALQESALTMQQGGGIGMDFSTLRPKGALVRGVEAEASGPLPFMDTWNAMCKTIESAGARRGAMMGILRCDHPDIEAFIEAKSDPARLRNFNVSVAVTDEFMRAVKEDDYFDLQFGGDAHKGEAGAVFKRLEARHLWDKIMRAAYEYAEPGVVFIDRYNTLNPLRYCETISATNPCGEQGLPPYGACLLGSINLAALVRNPFKTAAGIDREELVELTAVAIRMLDDCIEVGNYPLPQQAEEAKSKRRIGLGVTGLADALAMCGLHYASEEARSQAAKWMQLINEAAIEASMRLATEKGAFPLYDPTRYPYHQGIALRLAGEGVSFCGMRNSHVTSIAPTGTISLLAGNVSGGIEPIFDLTYRRKVLKGDDAREEYVVDDYAYRVWKEKWRKGKANPDLPASLTGVTAHDISPLDHLLMQAALQPHVDSSISKTINCPKDLSFEAFADIYMQAYDLGLKGCTAYRPNDVTGSVLERGGAAADSAEEAARKTLRTETMRLAGDVMAKVAKDAPLPPREKVMTGRTYQLQWPLTKDAFYITINDLIEWTWSENGDAISAVIRRRPYEIFINSAHLDSYPYVVGLTRLISKTWRRGGDVAYVPDELKSIFDPRGGAWMNGKYCPSLLAAIGEIIEQHYAECATFEARTEEALSGDGISAVVEVGAMNDESHATGNGLDHETRPRLICDACKSTNVVRSEGCTKCRACGFSNCG